MLEDFLSPSLYVTTQFFGQQLKNRFVEEQESIMETLFAASSFHAGVRRKAGPLFIIHPMQVALLVAHCEADQATIQAALLHDVLEDTPITAATLERQFGKETYQLVEAVTHFKMFSTKEFLEKVYEKSRKDPRVAWIKIADRCANLQDYHLIYTPEQHQEAIRESIEFYQGQLAQIPDVPKELVKLLERSIKQSQQHLA